MARVNAGLLSFNRGEVSKLALGRVDVAKLQLAAECQVNWEPKVIGPMALRPGLKFVGEVKDDLRVRLLPFIFSASDTAILEFSPGILRIWVDETLLEHPAVATQVTNGTFASGSGWTLSATSGCTAVITGGALKLVTTARGGLTQASQTVTVAPADIGIEHTLRIAVGVGPVTVRVGSADDTDDYVAVTSLDTGQHLLAFVPTTNIHLNISSDSRAERFVNVAVIEPPEVVELPTPYTADDLPNLRIDQSGDIVFIACAGHQQRKIERRSLHSFSIALFKSDDGPFNEITPSNAILHCSVGEGTGDLVSDRAYFQPGDVGVLFRLFPPGQRNPCVLGGPDSYSEPLRVSGVGQLDRQLSPVISGTWAGTIYLQRSVDGPTTGFSNVTSFTANSADGAYLLNDGDIGTAATPLPAYNNIVVWYRLGFQTSSYTSGSASVEFGNNATTRGGRFGIVRTTQYISPTVMACEVIAPISIFLGTSDWQRSDWSDAAGWPTSVAFHEGRLWWSGRDLVWGSRSNDYVSYAVEDSLAQSLGDSAAIIEQFGSGAVASVNWLLPVTRLLCGRETTIASIRSSSFDEPLTPTNFSVKDCATQGAARLPVLKIDKRGIFVQQSGRRVFELSFDGSALDYSAHDLTRLNPDIGLANSASVGFADLAVARQPDTAAYLVRNDGQCVVLLYDPDDEVTAWWRILTQGTIENVMVLPVIGGFEDQVYFVVKRGTRRFIEKLAPRENCVGGLINQLLDSHVVYQGAPATFIDLGARMASTVVQIWANGQALGPVTTNNLGVAVLPGAVQASRIVAGLSGSVQSYSGDPTSVMAGLEAFEGQSAEVFADQQPSGTMVRVGSFTVADGAITLPGIWQATVIVACFGYVAPFMSAKLAYAAQQGSPLTQKKKIDHIGLVLFDTHAQHGLQHGQRFDHLDALPQIEAGAEVGMNTVWGEYDEPLMELAGEWDTDARLCLLGQAPYPCKVGGVVVAVSTSEK